MFICFQVLTYFSIPFYSSVDQRKEYFNQFFLFFLIQNMSGRTGDVSSLAEPVRELESGRNVLPLASMDLQQLFGPSGNHLESRELQRGEPEHELLLSMVDEVMQKEAGIQSTVSERQIVHFTLGNSSSKKRKLDQTDVPEGSRQQSVKLAKTRVPRACFTCGCQGHMRGQCPLA